MRFGEGWIEMDYGLADGWNAVAFWVVAVRNAVEFGARRDGGVAGECNAKAFRTSSQYVRYLGVACRVVSCVRVRNGGQ